ncbi:MAG TPA: quinone-dependent dihydroorotate dehydrogenase [Polyangiaceae bacterium]
MYRLFKPILFLLRAETAHRVVMRLLGWLACLPGGLWWLRMLYSVDDPVLRLRAFGLELNNPLGLAAGLDKDAEAFEAFGALGFGLVEVGTLTGEPQPGNEKPRLFRLPRDRALINRMGFNNHGAAAAAVRLKRRRRGSFALGANIGRTKLVENERAIEDYVKSTRSLAPHVDYLVINVSSPNTPGLRALQDKESLAPLLQRVRATLDAEVPARRIPLLVKVAPDLVDADIDAVAEVALELGLDGIIATNTTIARTGLATPASEIEACGAGGLSGPPVAERALYVLRRLRAKLGTQVTLIASGGIFDGDAAFERICAGASIVQIYTGLIYEGPALPQRIARGLAQRLRQAGFTSVEAAIGVDVAPPRPSA